MILSKTIGRLIHKYFNEHAVSKQADRWSLPVSAKDHWVKTRGGGGKRRRKEEEGSKVRKRK